MHAPKGNSLNIPQCCDWVASSQERICSNITSYALPKSFYTLTMVHASVRHRNAVQEQIRNCQTWRNQQCHCGRSKALLPSLTLLVIAGVLLVCLRMGPGDVFAMSAAYSVHPWCHHHDCCGYVGMASSFALTVELLRLYLMCTGSGNHNVDVTMARTPPYVKGLEWFSKSLFLLPGYQN